MLDTNCMAKPVMCETAPKSKPSILDKAEIIERTTYEIIEITNLISTRIYGNSVPKIIQNPTGNAQEPNNIDTTLNYINTNICDIRDMLNDILKDL